MVVFERCDSTKLNICESPDVINAALEGTYVVLLENEESFMH